MDTNWYYDKHTERKVFAMKPIKLFAVLLSLTLTLAACGAAQGGSTIPENSVAISLSDDGVTVDGVPAGSDASAAVYTANDIIYYEAGRDFTYGEGTEADAHSAEDAAAHTVVHITQPGTYRVSGTLRRGQIAVDLGEDARNDPDAVVTLILDGVDLTCEVAPAVIFYRVYECGSDDADSASRNVDTSEAGANVVIADGTVNTVTGSYVARIYEPDSVELSEDGTEVEDAKKLHKYDGAFYSRMSLNISGGKDGSGILNINAANEGLDSELHLTINGGNIRILSGNDGINTNEDGVSVTTVNGGNLTIRVTGETGEGDGIDSNGWLVINGGTVTASACSTSADAGIDSDMGIHINGGTVIATGHMLDRIEDGGQNYVVFSFAQEQSGADTLCFKNEAGEEMFNLAPQNDYSIMVYSSPEVTEGGYTLWSNGVQLSGANGAMIGGPGMQGAPGGVPDGQMPPEPPEGSTPPEGEAPEGFTPPDGGDRPERPDGENGGQQGGGNGRWPNGDDGGEVTSEFRISDGGNQFSGITR